MKLNPDCIRDVMLTLEDELSIRIQENINGDIFFFEPIRIERLILIIGGKYGHASTDIIYSVLQLMENGYVVTSAELPPRGKHNIITLGDILYITPKGHEFAAATHNKEDWSNKIKPILGKVGAVSLSIVEAVSKGVTTAAIDRLLAAQDNV